jgi:histone H2A
MRITRSARAGLQFPVGRVHRHLREKEFGIKVKEGAPVYLAAVLEYLTAEVLDIARQHMVSTKRVRVGPQDIRFALLENDEELRQLAKGVQVASGGFSSVGVKALLEEEKKKKKKEKSLKLANKKPVLTRKRSLNSIEKAIKKKKQEKKKLKRRKASTSSSSFTAPSPSSLSAEADDDLPTFRRRVESSSSPSSATSSVSTFKWQYLDGGWKEYDKAAAEAVEVQYQEYVANPAMCDVRSVKSGRWNYMVDFINMQQTNIEHENHTVRGIRRIDLS